MDKFDKEVTDFLIYNEVMNNNKDNKSSYSGSSTNGCLSPTIIAILIVISILGWIFGIGSACVNSCNSKSDSSYSYTPRRSYSHSYSSRSYSSNNTYSLRSSSNSYSSRSYGTYSRKSSSSKKSSDPYNARDYYDADDFYYDNYDDFWDYEDAEDYYNEHYDD